MPPERTATAVTAPNVWAAPAGAAPWTPGPTWSRLPSLGVVQLQGADAVAFAQGQFSADMVALGAEGWQLAGYCTAKGRLLAIFDAWKFAEPQGEGLRLVLPAELAEPLRRRLGMFVLRAKVEVADVSAAWCVFGLWGPGTGAALRQRGLHPPSEPGQCVVAGTRGRLARVAAGPAAGERYVAVLPADEARAWCDGLATLAEADQSLWWWSQADAAVPVVFSNTVERFVPQAVNLEVLGGVNFRKGCYPGQEIVARSQYLGKLRRRMTSGSAAQIGSSADVFQDGSVEPVGHIVLAAAAPAGGWDVLIECPSERLEGPPLRAGSAQAAALALHRLPYALIDPTA